MEYTELDQEDDINKAIDKELENWPENGQIEFNQVTMSYRKTLEPSLKGLNFKAEAGMKVGIVGRTGAGKSSILQSLFRLIDLTTGI